MDATSYIPFCGTPPLPDGLWQRWVLDPVLLLTLVAGLGWSWHRMRGTCTRTQRAAYVAGWTLLTLALVSPLCALSVALFSARATQHMVLLVIAAPLLALALPSILGAAATRRLYHRNAAIPALAFAALLWGWHVPALYDATFRSNLAYWAMHVSLLAAALPLWMQLLQPGSGQMLARMLAGFGTFMQMGLLGALLTLCPTLLYASHLTSTLAWGLAPLADQQLGGLIMWIPGCSSLLLTMLYGVYRGLRDAVPPTEVAEPAQDISRRQAAG